MAYSAAHFHSKRTCLLTQAPPPYESRFDNAFIISPGFLCSIDNYYLLKESGILRRELKS